MPLYDVPSSNQPRLRPESAPAFRSTTNSCRTPLLEDKLLPRDVSSRFGLRLRELRRERNMTQLRMATDFGIDRSFISDVERGRKSISLPMLEVVALGFRLSLSDLFRDL